MTETELLEQIHRILREEFPSGNKGRDLYWATKLAALTSELALEVATNISRALTRMPNADMKATSLAADAERKRLREMK